MNESAFSREIRKSLDKFGYFKKMVGGAFIVPGIPDILGCYKGRFIGIECKQIKVLPKRDTSWLWNNLFQPDQILNLQSIKDAGGLAVGLIHNAIVSRNQYAIILNVNQIKQLNSISLGDYTGLMTLKRLFIVHRINGGWDVESLLNKV